MLMQKSILGETALHLAATSGYLKLVWLLLGRRVDPDGLLIEPNT